jgi:hypothetical protein
VLFRLSYVTCVLPVRHCEKTTMQLTSIDNRHPPLASPSPTTSLFPRLKTPGKLVLQVPHPHGAHARLARIPVRLLDGEVGVCCLLLVIGAAKTSPESASTTAAESEEVGYCCAAVG